MAKFLHVCKRGDKFLAKIIFKAEEGEKWATTSEAVFNWAKKNFKDGDTVDVQYNIKNSQYFVTKIMRPGTGEGTQNSEPTSKASSNSLPKCEDCGKELKDDKYKKCYNCNKKNPSKKSGGKYTKSPETQEAIARQNANHATSRALIALQGQVDINNIYEISEALHKHFLRLAKGE